MSSGDGNLCLACLIGAAFFGVLFLEETFFLSLTFAFVEALFLGDSVLPFFIICGCDNACMAHVCSDVRRTTVRQLAHLSKAFAELLCAALILYSTLFELLLKLGHLIVMGWW